MTDQQKILPATRDQILESIKYQICEISQNAHGSVVTVSIKNKQDIWLHFDQFGKLCCMEPSEWEPRTPNLTDPTWTIQLESQTVNLTKVAFNPVIY